MKEAIKIISSVVLLTIIFAFAVTLPGCNFVSDYGYTRNSDMLGYLQYTNKTLNVSVLTPESWKSEVTIGGQYVMMPPDPKVADISVASSTVEWLMGEGTPKSTTLEEYRKHRLPQINEKNMGPNLTVSVKKTTLAGHDAYEILYSMLPEGEAQYLVTQETFTVVDGMVYRLYYGASKDVFDKYLNELEVVKNSYRILK